MHIFLTFFLTFFGADTILLLTMNDATHIPNSPTEEKTIMKDAVIYARVSSEKQEENTSISMQVEKAQSYAATYDYHVQDVFQDVSSGGNTDRDGFQAMMTAIERGGVNAIIVFKLDRLHRSLKNLLNHKAELEAAGVSIVSVSEQIDTTTASGKLFFNIIGSFAEFEKDVINQRTSDGKRQKVRKGLFTAGRVPFGYELRDSDTLTVHAGDAARVKAIFRAKLAGKSLRDIAVDVLGDVKRYGQVNYILQNPAYTGRLRQENGKTVVIPAIITKQTFHKVNR